MPLPRPTRFLLLTPPAALTYYTSSTFLATLEAKYPPTDPTTTSSRALRTPSNPQTQHCPTIDVYQATRIPVSSLLRHHAALTNPSPSPSPITTPNISNKPTQPSHPPSTEEISLAWTTTFLNTRLLTTEASIVGLISNRVYAPGDTYLTTSPSLSQSQSQLPKPQPQPQEKENRKLLNGLFTIETTTPSGILVSWEMPTPAREFFERIARWGYPWRLMSGGRQEISVSGVYVVEGVEVVDVRYGSSHDYEVVRA
ncbi:hypothetical protein BO71DRAFT_441748, partial [Aspergillus ellipticus CBS 707.79]